MKFSLIIPLWNEGENVAELIRVIAASGLPQAGMAEMVLVNNGSTDQTGDLVDAGARLYDWIVPIHLAHNQNYGGGVYEGFKHARSDLLCYIPGDLQVLPDDVLRVYQAFCAHSAAKSALFVKGHRTVRHDPRQTQIVSHVYTFLANRILQLRVKDVNGLPKLFHRNLMDLVPTERMRTFVFDSQIIALARQHSWVIEEIPVTFHSRRVGVSSWSRKRFQVYLQVLRQIIRLRALRGAPGVPLERLR